MEQQMPCGQVKSGLQKSLSRGLCKARMMSRQRSSINNSEKYSGACQHHGRYRCHKYEREKELPQSPRKMPLQPRTLAPPRRGP